MSEFHASLVSEFLTVSVGTGERPREFCTSYYYRENTVFFTIIKLFTLASRQFNGNGKFTVSILNVCVLGGHRKLTQESQRCQHRGCQNSGVATNRKSSRGGLSEER